MSNVIMRMPEDKYIQIPDEIALNPELPALSKICYGYIHKRQQLWKNQGIMWEFKNKEIATHMKENDKTIGKAIDKLCEEGYCYKLLKRRDGKIIGYDYVLDYLKTFDFLSEKQKEMYGISKGEKQTQKNKRRKTNAEKRLTKEKDIIEKEKKDKYNNIYIEKEELVNRELKTDIRNYKYYQKIKGMISKLTMEEVENLCHNINYYYDDKFNEFLSHEQSMEITNFIDRQEYKKKYIISDSTITDADIPF